MYKDHALNTSLKISDLGSVLSFQLTSVSFFYTGLQLMLTNDNTVQVSMPARGFTDTSNFKVSLITLIVFVRLEQGCQEVSDNRHRECRHHLLNWSVQWQDNVWTETESENMQKDTNSMNKMLLIIVPLPLLFTARDGWKSCWYGKKKEKKKEKNALDGSKDTMDGLIVQVSASVSPQMSEKSD